MAGGLRAASGPRATRRELLRTTIALGAGAASLVGAESARALAMADAAALARLLEVELVVAFAYHRALDSGALMPPAARIVSLFSSHEREHVASLSADLIRLGGTVPMSPPSVAAAGRELRALHVTKSLDRLKSEHDAIELLIGAEAAAIGAYYVAISKLVDRALLQTVAGAMSAEAQHATALRRLLHPHHVEQYVPEPFVQGRHQKLTG